jgi:hypothetical protein
MGCGASQATTSAAVSEPVNQPVKPNRPAPIKKKIEILETFRPPRTRMFVGKDV